jgi:16S rRNA (uracil1498-N3)-methyltransferase
VNLFYCENIAGGKAVLSEEESMHCARVLRKRAGDEIVIIDGKGLMCSATLLSINKKACEVEVKKIIRQEEKKAFYLHIAIAPTKNISRIEWFLEKATEIGIDEITPIYCEHSERKTVRLDRLAKIVLSATKQSIKATLPLLNEPLSLTNFLEKESGEEKKFIAWCEHDDQDHLKDNYQEGESVTILVGPEGGFSLPEVELAKSNGFIPVSLGKSRLRTETAGLAACLTINLINE